MKHLKEYVMQMIQFDEKTYGYEQRQELVRCKDCKYQECEGRNGNIICDITGEAHVPDWFCADGERNEKQ